MRVFSLGRVVSFRDGLHTRADEIACNVGVRGQHADILQSPQAWAKYAARHQTRSAMHCQRLIANFPPDWVERDDDGGARMRIRMWVMCRYFRYRYCDAKRQFELHSWDEYVRATRIMRRARAVGMRTELSGAMRRLLNLPPLATPSERKAAAQAVQIKRAQYTRIKRKYGRAAFMSPSQIQTAAALDLANYHLSAVDCGETLPLAARGEARPLVGAGFFSTKTSRRWPRAFCIDPRSGAYLWNPAPVFGAQRSRCEIQRQQGATVWLSSASLIYWIFEVLRPHHSLPAPAKLPLP